MHVSLNARCQTALVRTAPQHEIDAVFVQIVGDLSRDASFRRIVEFGAGALGWNDGDPMI